MCACAKAASCLVLPLSLFMCGNDVVVGAAQNSKPRKTEAGWREADCLCERKDEKTRGAFEM